MNTKNSNVCNKALPFPGKLHDSLAESENYICLKHCNWQMVWGEGRREEGFGGM